jgi:arabinogalactan endo-1,4-beta-galactosidase
VDNQTNWVGNKSFEYTNGVDIYAWIAAGDVLATKGVAAARTGEWALEHSFYRPYRAVTKQCLQFIANGTYRLSAWVMSTGGQTEAKLQVTDSQGTLAEIDIPQSSEWMQVQLDVAVTNNEAEINIISAGSGSGIWLRVDDLEFVRVE